MSWLGDVLKHLEISKAFTGAIFVSSLVVLIGPKLFPNAFDAVPTQWRWLVGGACIFSGTLLVLWAAAPSWRLIVNAPTRLLNSPSLFSPTAKENGFLVFLGENFPNDSAHLDRISNDNISKLETLEMSYDLQRKGLVRVNPFDTNLVSLTPEGRKYALRLTQSKT
jgi:hypothetical protein